MRKHLSRVLLVLTIGTCCSISCKKDTININYGAIAEDLSIYLYAYTSGMISKASPIKIRFAQSVVEEAKIGTVATNLIRFSPSIDGEAIWEDTHTLRFNPSNYLKSKTTYVSTLNLEEVFSNIPDHLKKFQFEFQTLAQHLVLDFDRMEAVEPTDMSKQSLLGTLRTSDVVTAEEINAVLTAKQGNTKLPITWSTASDQMNHHFVVNEVKRGTQASKVTLYWDGKAIDMNQKGEQEIIIPAIGDFRILQGKFIQGQDQHIALDFSDPLQAGQDLTGLVTVSNYTNGYKFLIEGNQLRIYLDRYLTGTQQLTAVEGIKNAAGEKMAKASVWQILFESPKPQVRLVGEGMILPDANSLVFPFEAINLNAVEVEVFKIFNNNILQFLQANEMDGSYDLERVGRIVLQQKVNLNQLNMEGTNSNWTRYALDLRKLITPDPQAIYQVRIGFRPTYSNYYCGTKSVNSDAELVIVNKEEEPKTIWDSWYGTEGYYDGFNWEDRDDPCKPAYYNYENFVRRNVFASNLGVLAKGGSDNSMLLVVTDLRNANPLSGVTLEVYDYQQQLLATAQTNSEGLANVQLARPPFVVIAKQGEQRGYLKLMDGNALSLSRFDVAGAVTQKGLKGFIYGERSVWRPGDSIYLNFMIENENQDLPANYPITFELYDARGQLQERRTTSENVNYLYPLYTATPTDAPTGNWMVKVKAGGANFTKNILVETVKPNRLKVDLDFGKEKLSIKDEPIQISMQVNWLHGAPAQNLKTIVEMEVKNVNTTFPTFKNFEFDDPARNFYAEPKVVFDGTLNGNGEAAFATNVTSNTIAAGKLSVQFKARAFEQGGDFSTRTVTMPYDPYTSYAGVAIPKNKYGEKRLDIDKEGKLQFTIVDQNGNPINNKKLSIGLYRTQWRWWWDNSYDNVAQYNSIQHLNALKTNNLVTNTKGEATWNVAVNEWGRYLVRVCDMESGHCAGDYFYAGYPWYDDEDGGQNREGVAMITFSTDKDKYKVGETINLSVPASAGGKALVSIEDGTKVLQTFWVTTKAGDNTISFKTTPEMSPNVYAHLSLLQPYEQEQNDLPIRMYGVASIAVEDPSTVLLPQIKLPSELKPEQTFIVEVSEKNRQNMSYTIALVDEGLLDLTNFKTPDPHASFYAKEALGVNTWDVYDKVLGGFSGELTRILSIGGDLELNSDANNRQANRFKPVVKHLGPFFLEKGKTAKHAIQMPNYVGSVRVMLVASNVAGAYGNTEATVSVRNPLMILATLPRVLGLQERLQLPVSIFASDPKVKNVTLSIQESTGLVRINGEKSKKINFSKPGEELVNFDLEVTEGVGIAKFKISASGNGESASQDIEIQIRNPNPYATITQAVVLEANQKHTFDFQPIGIRGTNIGTLEISNIPPIDLEKSLRYLIQYPHGCIEQTTSAAFPQLFVNQLLELKPTQKDEIPKNIAAAIERLNQFQTAEGGFGYWPGDEDASAWGSNYAGHFMLEAQQQGYAVPSNLLNRWKDFQQKRARTWVRNNNTDEYYRNQDLDQAYRLYTLALAKSPELSAMNRMREMKTLSVQARWRLAAAYTLAGKPEIAKTLTEKVSTIIPPYQELGYTYGSDLRDKAMIVETMVLMNNLKDAAPIVQDIANTLSGNRWCSTQEIGYALLAVSKFVGDSENSKDFKFVYSLNGKSVNAGSSTPIMQIDVPVDGSNARKVGIENKNTGILYARLVLIGQPLIGEETATADHLNINVRYLDTKGSTIDPSNLTQGTDFVAEVTVNNPGSRGINYEEMVLTQIFPSGWEITNSRLDGFGGVTSSRAEYQDIRDDRTYTYFDIRKGVTQVYRIQLNAAYRGRYYLPAVQCAAMYDNSIQARVVGRWVEVTTPSNI